MKFKLSTFIITLCFSIVLINGQPNFMKFAHECKTEMNITKEEMFHVIRREIPETTNEECVLACILNKMEFLTTDNKINMDEILKTLEPVKKFNNDHYEKLKKIYEDCSATDSDEKDSCVAAKKFAQCVYPKEKEIHPPGRQVPPEFKNMKECKEKINMTDLEVRKIMRQDLPSNQNQQCFLACIQKKIGHMGSDNKIDIEKIEEKYKKMKEKNPTMYNKVLKIYTDCKTETPETDECVAAAKFAECTYPKIKMMHLPSIKRTNITKCINRTSATEVEVYNVLSYSVPKTKGESCFLACMQKRTGAMSKDNIIEIENMNIELRHMPPRNNLISKILEECKSSETKDADECLAAENFAKCLFPKIKELERFMFPPGRGPGRGHGHEPGDGPGQGRPQMTLQ